MIEIWHDLKNIAPTQALTQATRALLTHLIFRYTHEFTSNHVTARSPQLS
jgi:hypothetical protein